MDVALTAKPAAAAVAITKFPDFPPRDDMMTPRCRHAPAHQASLRRHPGNPDTTLAMGEVPVARAVPRGCAGARIPDLHIAFSFNVRVRRPRIPGQHGSASNEQGKPPDFVLAMASDHASRRDETLKWRNYANFGVTEYWRAGTESPAPAPPTLPH